MPVLTAMWPWASLCPLIPCLGVTMTIITITALPAFPSDQGTAEPRRAQPHARSSDTHRDQCGVIPPIAQMGALRLGNKKLRKA